MFGLFSNRSKTALTLHEPEADFIPYACHVRPETLLTKNGELVQMIKITGFTHETVGAEQCELRSSIREAIQSSIQDKSYAVWLHTVRRKKDLRLQTNPTNAFAKKNHEAWNKKNGWESTYVNEVYLTLIKDGATTKPKHFQDVLRMMSLSKMTQWHDAYLNKAHGELTLVANELLKKLEGFGAKRLTLIEKKGRFYSEPLQFLSKILDLTEIDVPLLPTDISEVLNNYKVAFGFNTLEVVSPVGKRFAALFTIKEYHELSTQALDIFLQSPQEFIITQTLDFVNSKHALAHYREQKKVVEASRDAEFYEASGLKDVLENRKNTMIDYGESQITIMFLDSNVNALEEGISKSFEALKNLGIVATRRDLRMEECYWAQLPGNFAFISRKRPINTSRFAGFASIANDPAGLKDGNHWGEAVTLVRSAAGTPYFFNFHADDLGHTAIMGPYGAGKTVLVNFLVSEAMKYEGKLFYVDCGRNAQTLITALGGKYYTFSDQEEHMRPSPLFLENTPENQVFVKEWMGLLAGKSNERLTDKEGDVLLKAAQHILKMPREKRTLEALLPGLKKAGLETLASRLQLWCGNGTYAKWLKGTRLDAVLNDKIYGFNVSPMVQDLKILAPQLRFILHMIEQSLDGTPTVIVLDEAWKLLNNIVFLPQIEALLDRFRAKNAIVVFATENVKNASASQITSTIVDKIATKVFLPNKQAESYSKAYKEVWKLNDEEYDMLTKMQAYKREFMLKNKTESIVLVLDLDDVETLPELSGA